ncbi:hypothetical protein ACF06P_35820 [Streptomyces sp. NPDC015684]|uniref:hypothetical protein n=1 Tax=Streptomyces sp. NPDC015684 TaxID=3364963 RepID=UPI003702F8CB
MAARICRSAAEAFRAGWDEKCDHDAHPDECPECGLTATEIAQLVILLSPPEAHASAPQAAA